MFGVHPASSSSWGENSCAKLCQIIVNSNSAFLQSVIENKIDLLDVLTLDELKISDDLGISLPFLCVHYERPEILTYLCKRGIDLSLPCDPMGFGNTMFYAGKKTSRFFFF